MSVYVISDTHFAHKNIIAYENRPFSDLLEMREAIIHNWNSKISCEDVIIHLGDFGMCNKEVATDILSKLNGYKILIKGNHDNHSDQWFLDAGFNEVHKYLYKWFDEINDYVLFTHQPSKIPAGTEYAYKYHLYGHVHGNGNSPGLYPTIAVNGACMCVERWNYFPVPLIEVLEQCKNSTVFFTEELPKN